MPSEPVESVDLYSIDTWIDLVQSEVTSEDDIHLWIDFTGHNRGNHSERTSQNESKRN